MSTQHDWLQGAIIYQIYPRSFYDPSGSGIGDIEGIIEKLDYLGGTPDSLGVTAIWLSPIYKSPMVDFGYDVADYYIVDPIFGTVSDVQRLIQEAHHRSIKVILDFVPNHTSDQHPWFEAAQSSVNDPKRDWYTWRNGKDEHSPPNNWLSVFGGSAWQLSSATGQYYLHSFLAQQPDLNWDNPDVRVAMKAAMRFWLDLGVDGFRVDAVDWLSKDSKFRDDPVNEHAINKVAGVDPGSLRHSFSRDGPHLFDRLNEMTEVLNEYDDRFMITEAHPETDDKIQGYLKYYQGVNPHLSAPFNLEGIYLPWKAESFRNFVNSFQAAMKPGYTPIYTVGNHDESRIASRIGSAAARTAALMLFTLPGMAFIYYGEELGMHDTPIAKDQLRDPFSHDGLGRDPERTPMQWDPTPNAGFSSGQPWLPVAPDYKRINVATEAADTTSSLNLYKRLINYRDQSPILKYGSYQSLNEHDAIFAYTRQLDSEYLLILLNFSNEAQGITIAGFHGTIALSTYLDHEAVTVNENIALRAHEGLIIMRNHD
jgi:alpha-glucosidase